MIFTKKTFLLFFCIAFVNLSFGQEKIIIVEEVEELTKEELEAQKKYYEKYHKSDKKKKKKTKRKQYAFNTFQYEFTTNGKEVQYITVKNKTKNAAKTIEIIPVDKVEDLDIISYNFGYEYHKKKLHDNDFERHYHENYIIYKNRKKLGLVLASHVIPAQFDSIGKPYLLRGEKPMMLVAKKKRGNYKWGIVKSDGSFLLPIEYDEISAPFEMDVTVNSYGSNSKKNNNVWSNSNSVLLTDGLYHNHKIMVRKNDKYGLYNANAEEELEVIYDKIEADNSLRIYTLQKGNESGFLIAKYNKIGVWGMNTLTVKNTRVEKYLKIFPTKEYQIIIKDKQIYIKYNSGITSKIRYDAIMKMIEE